MAEIEAPLVSYQNTQRFQVKPLPFWSLALTKIKAGPVSVSGIGFDGEARIAAEKSHSEAIERWFEEKWALSGKSPLDGVERPAPPAEAGTAAHPSHEAARVRAFEEWRERALLAQVWAGNYRLTPSSGPRFGWLFEALLGVAGVELQCYAGDGDLPLGFAVGFLKTGGVIFGSAVRGSHEEAVRAAACECVRKTAFLESWRRGAGRTVETELFLSTVGFWLTEGGAVQARRFIERAILSRSNRDAAPIRPSTQYAAEGRIGKWHICSYFDPNFPLPRITERIIPLV